MSTNDDPGIDRILRRLDRLTAATSQGSDQLLRLVAFLGGLGPGIGVGFLVDGVLVVGAIGPPATFAEDLTDAATDALRAHPFPDETVDALLRMFVESESSTAEGRELDQELLDKYPAETGIDDIAVVDSYAYFRALRDRPTVDLHDVQVHYGNAEPISISSLRLNLRSISAWWPLKSQSVNVIYNVSSIEPT